MKKTLFSIFTVGFFVLAVTASAQMGMMGNYYGQDTTVQLTQSQEVNNSLQDIYKSQNISNQGQVDCGKVTDDQFEKLGDAYMGVMLPNQQQHEAMDNMMGGEGSTSLRLAHINMGRSYLGCWGNYNSGPIYMPMMGGGFGGYGMMGGNYGNYYPGGMMGGYFGGYSWFSLITMLLLWALIILGIVMAVKWIRKK